LHRKLTNGWHDKSASRFSLFPQRNENKDGTKELWRALPAWADEGVRPTRALSYAARRFKISLPSFCASLKDFWYSTKMRFSASDWSGVSLRRSSMSRTWTGLGRVASSVSSSRAVERL